MSLNTNEAQCGVIDNPRCHRNVAMDIDALVGSRARNSTLRLATSSAGTAFTRRGQYRRPTFRELITSNPFLYPGVSCLYFFLIFFVILNASVRLISMSRVEWTQLRSSLQDSQLLDYTDMENELRGIIDTLPEWCFKLSENNTCPCEDPLTPRPRFERDNWLETHELNKGLIHECIENNSNILDVVFFGDSITEEWNGRWHGKQLDQLNNTNDVFKKKFKKKEGGQIEGLALGIAGDTAMNLLWRLQHGELPKKLKSKVFWVTIGTNDFLKHKCDENVLFIGIKRVVEEISLRKPESTIVLNGVLPTTLRSDGKLISNYKIPEKLENNDTIPDIWPHVESLNVMLDQYCQNKQNVVYFDASQIFLAQLGNDSFRRKESLLMSELMRDYVHPTALGHELWAKEIVKEIQFLTLDDDFND